jgi:hypothetical protein
VPFDASTEDFPGRHALVAADIKLARLPLSAILVGASGTSPLAFRLRDRFVGFEHRDLLLESIPDMIIEIFIDASPYSARLAKPFFLATALARGFRRPRRRLQTLIKA